MTPRDYGATLALATPPLTDAQVEEAARLLIAGDDFEDAA